MQLMDVQRSPNRLIWPYPLAPFTFPSSTSPGHSVLFKVTLTGPGPGSQRLIINGSLSPLHTSPSAVDRSGDAHAMWKLANVLPPSRLDNGGLGHPAVAMDDPSAGDERPPN